MAKHRLYISSGISANSVAVLDTPTTHYALNVLRCRNGCEIEAFDGKGNCFHSILRISGKRSALLETGAVLAINRESPLRIELLQVLSRGEKMDWAIQKAVELGVSSIRPLTSERCNVKLDAKREQSRHSHWQAIISNACEQCGRNYLPELHALANIYGLAKTDAISSKHRWLFHPDATQTLSDSNIAENDSISLLIGPEGGLSDNETQLLGNAGFIPKHFGPRILRTETAAIAAIAAIQSRWGDMR